MTEDTQIESMVTITGAEYVRLMAENAKLREALEEMLEDWDNLDPDFPEMRVAKARAALGGDT